MDVGPESAGPGLAGMFSKRFSHAMHRRVRRRAAFLNGKAAQSLLASVYTYGKSALAGVFVFLLVLLLVVLGVVAVSCGASGAPSVV